MCRKKVALASVFTQSLGLDELIPHMNILAQGINEAIASRGKTPPTETPSAEPPSGGSSSAGTPSGGTPGIQPEDIGTLFEEKPEPDPVVGDDENELELGDAGQLFETVEPPAVEANGDGEEAPEPAEPEESEQESLTERLLQRKSPIDATDENPAYQKSIDDLENTAESPPEETVQ